MCNERSVVVQKFGGTSLGTTELIKKAAYKVSQTIKNGEWPVVVASAMAGSTNNLVTLANLIGADRSSGEYDVVISAGEQISSGLLAAALLNIGVKSKSMLAWQIPVLTSECFGGASITRFNTDIINEYIDSGIVPVIAGFQGMTEGKRLTTLGRGGSDLTAVAVAAAISAKRCDIFTDVEGVYAVDPRLVSGSRKIPFITYDLMLEMASHGAKVLQEQSVTYAMNNGVPVYVASSFNNKPGTLVGPDDGKKLNAQQVVGITQEPLAEDKSKNIISVIGRNISVDDNTKKNIRQTLESLDVACSFIDGSPNRLSFIISERYTESVFKELHVVCNLNNIRQELKYPG